MTDGVNIDFSALKSPNYVGDYVNAFQVGQGLARQGAQDNALAGLGVNAMTGAAPMAQMESRLAAMSPGQRVLAARQADTFANLGIGLKAMAYDERKAVIAHMAPTLARNGLDPAALASFDPTDANLDAQIATASGLARKLGPDPSSSSPRAVGD
ncbi:MAG: hypothetical protein ACYC8V_06710 [Caulobacteraceae bacterium]